MKRIKIKELLNNMQGEESVLVNGWVRTRRDSKGGFSFLEINDGSCQANIQAIVEHSLKEFAGLDKKITTDPGWYLIFDGDNRLYVCKSDDLNARLNTHNRSLDNFANPKGPINNRRNFIKKLSDIDYFKELKVLLIDELTLCTKMKLESPLSNLDRQNIEKFIDVTGIGCNIATLVV